ncbi:coiled-coil domain-containing protein [Pseudomonas syringae]|nr:hypothetical protein [Pseudomonas syringae]
MQELATYSFFAKLSDLESAEQRFHALNEKFVGWMQAKGVTDVTQEKGRFQSNAEGAVGSYTRTTVDNALGRLSEILMVDMILNDHAFVTNIKFGQLEDVVYVYCSLSAKRLSHIIAPLKLFPRCPSVIRDVISSYGDWVLGGEAVPPPIPVEYFGEDNGILLCEKLLDENRHFPVIVVSTNTAAWRDLADKLARDLVGVAHVAKVDENGSWALTEELGKQNSCYLGAVRLYWPLGALDDLRSTVWTAEHLDSKFGVNAAGANKFLSVVRGMVMETSSLSLSVPKSLREISKHELRDRISRSNAQQREEELNSIIDENSNLADSLDEARAEIASLKLKLTSLYSALEQAGLEDEGVESEEDLSEVHIPFTPGEVRYYKKTKKSGRADNLVVTNSCNHNSWKPLHKAIQAEKGVQKLEKSKDYKTIQRCNECTGGGLWKVQW